MPNIPAKLFDYRVLTLEAEVQTDLAGIFINIGLYSPRVTRGGGPPAGPHGWRGAPECNRRPAPPASVARSPRARRPPQARLKHPTTPLQPHICAAAFFRPGDRGSADRKSTRLNSSHLGISYAVFC